MKRSQSAEAGFTLIELVVAIAIAAMLATGVWSTLVSTTRIAENRKADSDILMSRQRALELIRDDFRGRVTDGRDRKLKAVAKDGAVALAMTTTTDGLASGGTQRTTEVSYMASGAGLKRQESGVEGAVVMPLLKEPVGVEFGGVHGWRREAEGDDIQALRLTFKNPDEVIVIR
jgi:prepilin-type N-terminal cleavage/methylation domain-containing protein